MVIIHLIWWCWSHSLSHLFKYRRCNFLKASSRWLLWLQKAFWAEYLLAIYINNVIKYDATLQSEVKKTTCCYSESVPSQLLTASIKDLQYDHNRWPTRYRPIAWYGIFNIQSSVHYSPLCQSGRINVWVLSKGDVKGENSLLILTQNITRSQ